MKKLRNDYYVNYIAQYLGVKTAKNLFMTSERLYKHAKKNKQSLKDIINNDYYQYKGFLTIFEKACSASNPKQRVFGNEDERLLLDKLESYKLPGEDDISILLKKSLNKLNKENIPSIIEDFSEYFWNTDLSLSLKKSFYNAFHKFVKNPIGKLYPFIIEDNTNFLKDFSRLDESKKKYYAMNYVQTLNSNILTKELVESFSSKELLQCMRHIVDTLNNKNLEFFKELFCKEEIIAKLDDNGISETKNLFSSMIDLVKDKMKAEAMSELFSYFLSNMNINDKTREDLVKYCENYFNEQNINLQIVITKPTSKDPITDEELLENQLPFYSEKFLDLEGMKENIDTDTNSLSLNQNEVFENHYKEISGNNNNINEIE